jgi:hypothetical protein
MIIKITSACENLHIYETQSYTASFFSYTMDTVRKERAATVRHTGYSIFFKLIHVVFHQNSGISVPIYLVPSPRRHKYKTSVHDRLKCYLNMAFCIMNVYKYGIPV